MAHPLGKLPDIHPVSDVGFGGRRCIGQRPRKIEGAQETWLRARMTDAPFTLRSLVAELAERGLRVDYHTMWNFAHAEGLNFKKNRTGQ